MTNYDTISTQYQRCKHQPWRWHIEQFTLFQILGDLSGRSVLDLACGEGFYSRLLKQHGAKEVVGADLSPGMIELAKAEEAKEPLGIDYRVGDAMSLEMDQRFDVVMAAYLLNNARSREELLTMCQTAFRQLKPGGRFVGVNNHPGQSPQYFDSSRKYGFVKALPGELREGAPITFRVYLDDGPFEITNYYLSMETQEWALKTAGFCETRWISPQVSPEGVGEFAEYWMTFLAHPSVVFFDCLKAI